ncbi:MAG: tetratricopeptide repeat protein [Deltaproteobacteria bacterium]|nr:tetratricopeptide repeat protein [Deltaproteobacteria bacterium]
MKETGRIYTVFAVMTLFAVSLGVYSVTLKYGFVYDDHSQVLENPWIRELSRVPDILFSSGTAFQNKAANTFRPVLHLVFMAEYHAFGLKAWGWHLVNVLLHSLNAIMVFLVASTIFSDETAETLREPTVSLSSHPSVRTFVPPFFAGLLFALHPVNSEVVSWVSAVPELTFTLFLLLSFYIYARGGQGAPVQMLSLVFFFLALLGKETALSLVFIIFAYEYSGGEGGLKRGIKRCVPYLLAAVPYMALRTYAVGGVLHHKQAALSAYGALLNAFPLVQKYFWKLLWPSGLNALYEFYPVSSVLDPGVTGGAAAALMMAAALFLARRSKATLVGLTMVTVPLLPVLYIPALSSAPFADRYMYLPTAGLAILFSCAMKKAFSTRRSGPGPAGVILLIFALAVSFTYAAASVKRSLVWKDDYSLWADTVKKSPNNANAHYNLAWASQERGYIPGAIEHYREAARLDPARSADAHYNLGVIYNRERVFDMAAVEFREALRADPGYAEAQEKLRVLERRLSAPQ